MTAEPAEVPWWRDAVVYQIYPRSFSDSTGDGVGDLRGIIDRVDHIAALGVDAVWLSPIFTSPMADFGYDVADYTAVDPVFGTDADLDDLIAELHGRQIRLLLDWVPNHTSIQHPWFVESRSSRDNPRRDWYVWKDQRPDGSPPNNWMAAFKGIPAWTHDPSTDQSYLHMFLPEQPDLNWANPDVESAMHDVLRHWLDRGVDGFRADVVHLIGKGTDVDDLPEDRAAVPLLAVDRPLGHELLRRIRRLLDSYDHSPMMVGEVYLLAEGQSASYLGDPERGEGELHLSFDFRPVHTRWDATRLHRTIELSQAEFAEPHWPTWVLSNHDRPRHATRFGGLDARSRAAAVLSLTMRGTPFLYAGEELGLADADVPNERVVDPDGRDGCRAPIPWKSDGDSETGHGWPTRPWLPFPANASTHAVDVQDASPGSILELYKTLTRLRRERPSLRRGTMDLEPLHSDVIRFRRSSGDDALTVLVNLSEDHVDVPADLTGQIVLRTSNSWAAQLEPDEAMVIEG